MEKMGKLDIKNDLYDLKELEKDRIKKLRNYYKKELQELGLNFDVLPTKYKKEILDFFQDLSEKNESGSQIINSIKKSNKKGLKIILENLMEVAFEERKFIVEFENNSEKLDYLFQNVEKLSKENGYRNIILEFNQITIKILEELNNLLSKYYNIVFIHIFIEIFLIKHLIFSWENIYFSRNISSENRDLFYSSFKFYLDRIEKIISRENSRDIYSEIGIDENNINYKKIIYSFLSLNDVLNLNFNNKVEFEFELNTTQIKQVFDATVFAMNSDDISFKDLKTEGLKKDNLFNKRIKDIEELTNRLENLEDGAILEKNKEIFELLYLIFYKNKKKIKIEGILEEEKNFFTLIRYVLEGKDSENKIIKILNKYVRAGMFIANGKEEELKYILELEQSLEKLFWTINKGTIPKLISRNLKIALELFIKEFSNMRMY